MTIIKWQDVPGANMAKGNWTVAEAKAKFSEVLNCAEKEGPQRITRHGEEMAVVVSKREWERRTKRKGTLLEFFKSSPLWGSGIEIPRREKSTRKIDL